MDITTNNLPTKVNNDVKNIIEKKVSETNDVKQAIDLFTTKTSLEQDGTVEKLVTEKTEELKNDAEAKRIEAEAKKLEQEVIKVKQETEKELAELEKQKSLLQGEIEQMQKEADKAEAYFQANKDILKCGGIFTKKSLGVMKFWLYPSSIVFAILQILMFPITIVGAILEKVIDIVGSVGGSVKNNALKITISVLVIILLVGATALAYWGGSELFRAIK